MTEFTSSDDFLGRVFGFDDNLMQFYDQKSILEKIGIQVQRKSMDKKKNNNGDKLIEICKNNSLIILNGRYGKDKNIGRMTFRDISVLDYSIASVQGLHLLSDFEIIELDSLFSDGHALLSFKLNIEQNTPKTHVTNQRTRERVPKWNEKDGHKFIENVNVEKIRAIEQQLNIQITAHEMDQNFMDNISSQLSNIFLDSANVTFKTATSNKRREQRNKPWFGPACKTARRKYNNAKKKFNVHRSNETRRNLLSASKNYKGIMNKFINKYNKENESKLRNMQRKQPKDYWKYLNSLKNKKNIEKPDLSVLYEHFKAMNSVDSGSDQGSDSSWSDHQDENEYLNSPITCGEIEKCIRNLKNSKSPGLDNILNEYIKNTKLLMLPLYVKLFNAVLDSGIIPSSWVEGIIIPLYKKGDPLKPSNYRPITLLSCMGKLFTAVLNSRLNNYLEEINLLNENQAGFRQNYATTDHIFTLHCIIELLKFQKKKLFCSFIDFSKAFDSVWRVGLWKKLLESKVNGKFLQVIKNLYSNVKSCVSINNELSPFFGSYCGVRQGENLSPVLFSLYLNDLEAYLFERQNVGVTIDIDSEEFFIFLKLIVLLYADDTVILADTAESFQQTLNDFYEYCQLWKLNVNIDKTKVIVFGSRIKRHFQFKLGPNILEIVDSYKYLGIFFSKTGSFLMARKHIAEQARKALYYLYTRINNLNLPIDLQIKLFDHTILPILTYGCEVWGFENIQILERIHAEFLRTITKTKKSTPYYMLFAELGRYPLEITIKIRMIGFWTRIISGKETKLSYLLYNTIKDTLNLQSKWINYVKQIFIDCGKIDIWLSQNSPQSCNVRQLVKRILIDQNLQTWHSSLQNSSKGTNYQLFKDTVQLEPYFLNLNRKHYLNFVKFRTGNHRMPIETLRWEGIPLYERICTLCDTNDVADEYHYLLFCRHFTADRMRYIRPYYYRRPNVIKFKELMTCTSPLKLRHLCIFVGILLKHFNTR